MRAFDKKFKREGTQGGIFDERGRECEFSPTASLFYSLTSGREASVRQRAGQPTGTIQAPSGTSLIYSTCQKAAIYGDDLAGRKAAFF